MDKQIEELKELKGLLDEGILTQEEYDFKKKEILNSTSFTQQAPNNNSTENQPVNEQLAATPNQTAATGEPAQSTVQPPKKKNSKLKIIVIIVLLVIGVGYIASKSSSGGSDSSTFVTENRYVTMIKNSTKGDTGITYGEAFNAFFSNPSWRYFTSTDGDKVVEFTGDCTYNGYDATMEVQFLLSDDLDTFEVYYMEIDDEACTRLQMAAYINKIFNSYDS